MQRRQMTPGARHEGTDTHPPDGEGATRLSRPQRLDARIHGRLEGLARVSLCSFVMAPALIGCLDPPPEFTVPEPVPPVIMIDKISPEPTTVVATTTPTVEFTIPFRGDDAGDTFYAFFVRDILDADAVTGFPNIVGALPIPSDPRPFAEQKDPDRSIRFPWKWDQDRQVSVGCHTLTMILARRGNFLEGAQLEDPLSSTRVTWFLALSSTSETANCGTFPEPQ